MKAREMNEVEPKVVRRVDWRDTFRNMKPGEFVSVEVSKEGMMRNLAWVLKTKEDITIKVRREGLDVKVYRT